MPAPYPKATRQRILADIRDQIRVKGYTRTMNDISHANDISRKTLESWWTQYKKAKASVQAQEETPSPPYGNIPDCSSAGRGDSSPVVVSPPARLYLIADCGQFKCSRCRSSKHLRRDGNEFFCCVCSIRYEFDPGEDYQVKSYDLSAKPWDWML